MSPSAPAAPQSLNSEKIRLRIFMPLMAAGLVLLAAFVIGVYWKTTHEISNGIDNDIKELNETFEMVLQSESDHMDSLLDTLMAAPKMAELFEAQARGLVPVGEGAVREPE